MDSNSFGKSRNSNSLRSRKGWSWGLWEAGLGYPNLDSYWLVLSFYLPWFFHLKFCFKHKWLWRKGTLLHCWRECRLVQPLWKAVWRYLKKLKMDLPYDSVIPLLGIYLKKPETLIWKNIGTPIVILALFTLTKIWKQPKCPPADEWIKQLKDIYTMEYYSAVKQKKILPFVTAWMGLENIMLSEISQSEKGKYHMISLICRI